MNKQAINTFIKGMNKDIDKSVISKDSYLDAYNFRIVTSEGSSSGAFENIKGNKLIGATYLTSTGPVVNGHSYLVVKDSVQYNGIDVPLNLAFTGVVGVTTFIGDGKILDLSGSNLLPINQLICGAVRLRNDIILFTTSNVSTPVHGVGRNMIYKLTLNKTTEEVSTITLLYDDNLNPGLGADTLDFSFLYKIKAVSKYETPNVQKIYWTDGYNNLRYANVAANLTLTGDAYTANDYMLTSMFEFLPDFTPSKPVLADMIGGDLMSGMVQYSYQLYRLNGAETAFSPVSDIIHIVTDNDFKANTIDYKGSDVDVQTGKGCKLSISNLNSGYNRLRLIRIYYPTLNAVPTISIVNEIEITDTPSTISISDIGNIISSLTLDEFNISSTELFSCEDLAIKNNRLFAANINKSEFIVEDFDTRVVRFRGTVNEIVNQPEISLGAFYEVTSTCTYISDHTVNISIPNIDVLLSLAPGDSLVRINKVTVVDLEGYYTDGSGSQYFLASTPIVATNVVYSSPDISFRVTSTSAMFTDYVAGPASWDFEVLLDYDYSTTTVYNNAVVNDVENGDLIISQPIDDSQAEWDIAGWSSYVETHDGINKYNDPYNDGTGTYDLMYQKDCTTLGAEGPNIKIDFATEELILDSSNANYTFSANPPTDSIDLSYSNYASPWKDGKLSWQRDEVYRLYAVWGNDRGQVSDPSWICDLRMPSLHTSPFLNSDGNTVYPGVLSKIDSGNIIFYRLYPRIYFKSFPTNASWVQIYRVKRNREDRFVVTQCYAISSYFDVSVYRPELANVALSSSGEIIKLVSPEINITKNIAYRSNDYLDYATNFSTYTTTSEGAYEGSIHKMKENTVVLYSSDNITQIEYAVVCTPLTSATDSSVLIGTDSYNNFNEKSPVPNSAKGCTGLVVKYTNASWAAEGVDGVIVNYKSNVYGSQYNGHTYENRGLNISIPCSGIISSTSSWNDIYYGDTFINYFDCSTLLADLSQVELTSLSDTYIETIYVPLESSINCDLRHDKESRHMYPLYHVDSMLRQEFMGDHLEAFNQTTDLYLYNTVYSQQTSAQYAVSVMFDTVSETSFDCLIKASNVKYTGELSDSWTKFNTNEEIEVDSNYGEVRAIDTINDRLFFWQEDAFGNLSVNERSLIQDSSSSNLSLGTGGVLDRYDYISSSVGILNKFTIVKSDTAIYWFYNKDTSIYRFDNKLINLTKDKGLWSWFKDKYASTYSVHGVYDRTFDDVIYTLYSSNVAGYTIGFNEQTDQFVSFYDFVPYMYIDYKDGYLSTKPYVSNSVSFMFMHNSDINPRCRFYSLLESTDDDLVNTFASTIKLMYNDNYPITKVFDTVEYISNAFDDSTGIEQYGITFDKIRCYNDYQNTDWIDLLYPVNIMRRERGWTLVVPRNLVTTDYTTSSNIFDPINIDSTGTKVWHERIRDKYMVLDLSFDNETQTKFVVPFIGIKYRLSYR